jgi:membrane dipeptidase
MMVIDGLSASNFDEAHIPRLRAGDVDAVHQTVGGQAPFLETCRDVVRFRKFLQAHADDVTLATTAGEIEGAKAAGKTAVVLGFQGSDPLRGDETLLPVFHGLGVRIVQIAYNRRTWAGDGCTERTECGLSDMGVRLVEELNRLKMIVDCSHTGERTTLDAIEASRAPVIVSHTNVRALCDNPRGVRDVVIDRIAEKGGVIGLTSFSYFLSKQGPATLEDYLDHVDYIRKRVGVDHVAVALDLTEGRVYDEPHDPALFKPEAYPPVWTYAEGLDSAAKISNVTRGLVERDYQEPDIRKILGENWLRVYRAVWGH